MGEETRDDSTGGSVIPKSHLEALWTVNEVQIISHSTIFHQVLTNAVPPG